MTVNLTWVDTRNSGATYNVHRSPNVPTPTWATIASGLTAMNYTDANLAAGSWVYYVTAVVGGVESDSSNTATASIPVFPPTSLSAVSS